MSQPKGKTVESFQQLPFNTQDDPDADDSESSKTSYSNSRSTSDNSHSCSQSDDSQSNHTNSNNSTENSECHDGSEGAEATDNFSDSDNADSFEDDSNCQKSNSEEEITKAEESISKNRAKLITERPFDILKNNSIELNRPKPEVIKKFDRWSDIMCYIVARYHKELCVAFLLVASAIAAFRSGPPKTRTVQIPQPFFPDYTALYLQDNYKGEYVDLVQKSIPITPSFVFYYAPWDSESVAARSVFFRVAQHFHASRPGQIKFFAVNCWWPEGQCRQNYKNLSHYPIFVAHIGTQSGIIYSGPIREELMIKFMESVLRPITRLDTEEELWRFRTQHDAIMLASFNFSEPDTPEAYETYLQMALRNFEADPFGQVGFGIFLRPNLGEKFFLTSANSISLVLFNEIHTAKWHGINKTKAGLKGPVGQVVDWIIERTKHTPITWAYRVRNGFANRPISLGSNDFANELNRGPLFLLITRRYFPSAYSPFYAQVKEVALDYFNCNKSINVTKLRRFTHKINAEWIALWKSIRKICRLSKKASPNCDILEDQLKHWEQKEVLFRRESLSHYENVSAAMNFTGSSCTSERKFRFLTIDPVDVPHFISLGLGGLGATESSDPLAFIIDARNEIILPFTTFNISDIASTIKHFSDNMESGNGQQFVSSSQRWVEKLESSKPNEIVEEESSSSLTLLCGDGVEIVNQPKPKKILLQEKTSRLRKLTSNDLLQFVNKTHSFENDNPLLLLYTATYCGFCSIALAHMINLSVFLSEYYYSHGINITLAKIDTLKNSLPVELSPEYIPSIVFFPAQNRTDSRIFPMGKEINSKTLLRFLLSELDPKTRIKFSLHSPACQSNKSESSPVASDKLCIAKNKALVTNRIHSILQQLQVDFETAPQGGKVDGSDSYNQFDPNFSNPNTKFVSSAWRNELLDHLRSMRLTLDTL